MANSDRQRAAIEATLESLLQEILPQLNGAWQDWVFDQLAQEGYHDLYNRPDVWLSERPPPQDQQARSGGKDPKAVHQVHDRDQSEDEDENDLDINMNDRPSRKQARNAEPEKAETTSEERFAGLDLLTIPLAQGEGKEVTVATFKDLFNRTVYQTVSKNGQDLKMTMAMTNEIFNFFSTRVISPTGENYVVALCKQGQAVLKDDTLADTATQAAISNHDVQVIHQFFTSLAKADLTNPLNGQAYTMTVHILALLNMLDKYDTMTEDLRNGDNKLRELLRQEDVTKRRKGFSYASQILELLHQLSGAYVTKDIITSRINVARSFRSFTEQFGTGIVAFIPYGHKNRISQWGAERIRFAAKKIKNDMPTLRLKKRVNFQEVLETFRARTQKSKEVSKIMRERPKAYEKLLNEARSISRMREELIKDVPKQKDDLNQQISDAQKSALDAKKELQQIKDERETWRIRGLDERTRTNHQQERARRHSGAGDVDERPSPHAPETKDPGRGYTNREIQAAEDGPMDIDEEEAEQAEAEFKFDDREEHPFESWNQDNFTNRYTTENLAAKSPFGLREHWTVMKPSKVPVLSRAFGREKFKSELLDAAFFKRDQFHLERKV
ncbi:MAG: hypothetical protein M1822_004506 [Bathelium mastoideum]|nr:MAG: hypothetical protein M1822_004506 [Bathelium mastoideum]